MTTRIELTPAPGRPRVRTASGLLRPQVRSTDGTTARVTLVATGAMLLAGDHVDLVIRVGAGLRLDLSDVAGTVVHDGRGAGCSWTTSIVLDAGATLVWHGEPLVVSDGARLDRRTDVDLADGARLLMRDTLALGRTGESGGSLTCRTRMSLDGEPALAEDLLLSAQQRVRPGILGEAKVVDTITALGWQPDPHPVPSPMRAFDLPAPGRLARALVPRAHLSPAPDLWTRWTQELSTT